MARPPLPPADPRTTDDRAAKTWRRPPNPLAVRTRTDSHRGRKPESAAGTCRPPGLEPEQRLGRRAAPRAPSAPPTVTPGVAEASVCFDAADHAGNRPPGDAGFAKSPPGWTPDPIPAGLPFTGSRPVHPRLLPGRDHRTTSMDCASRGAPVAPSRAPSSERPLSEPVRRPQRPRKTPAVCASKQRSRAVSIAS